MGYTNKFNSKFLQTKLTAKGRQKIAEGKLNFKHYVLGDSEIDYNYPSLIQRTLKPKDFNPNIKSYITKQDCDFVFDLNDNKVRECCVSNMAISRGLILSGDTSESYINEDLVLKTGVVELYDFNGTNSIDLQTVDFNDGDFILFKIDLNENTSVFQNSEPFLYLWYKITKTPATSLVELDRNLPTFLHINNNIDVNFIIYPQNNSPYNYYTSGSTVQHWHQPTLDFVSNCDVTNEDPLILNMNNVWNEDLVGMNDNYETHECFGSIEFVGQKEYLGYNIDCVETREISTDCEDKLLSQYDDYVKGISIIHFSNNNISNQYGEKYHIDHENNKYLELLLPSIMWHRRTDVSKIGMNFKSTGVLKTVESSNIQYYDLIEDESLIVYDEPMVVGRVYPDLKIVVIHDEELLATMSYKSSRNFTLPRLNGSMITPVNGIGTGILPKGKTMYVTYVLESDNGLTYSLPQQKYTKYVNDSKIDRDVSFKFEDTGLLKYMKKVEQNSYSGLGFYAHHIKLLYQIVDNREDRPESDNWSAFNLTNLQITTNVGETINPVLLENQNSENIGFILTPNEIPFSYNYNLNVLNIPEINCCGEKLTFGDEELFFGLMNTEIGACFYRYEANLNINVNELVKSSNPTFNNQNLIISEIGLLDEEKELVAITKLSHPVEATPNTLFGIEISLDF